jgi:RNA polymerase sigma-70 factor (ECF subfamily)
MGELSRLHEADFGDGVQEAAGLDVERVVADHCGFVWRVLRRLGLCSADADDATQEVFVIVSQKLDRVAPDRIRSFLYGTALRVASHARRGQMRRREVLEEPDDPAAPDGQSPEKLTELNRTRALLDRLLEQLPGELRRVLVLADLEQLEVREIAAFERIAVGTAASRLRRARQRFRELLELSESNNPFASRP